MKLSYKLYGLLLFSLIMVSVIFTTKDTSLALPLIGIIIAVIALDVVIRKTKEVLVIITFAVHLLGTPILATIHGIYMGGDEMLAGEAQFLGFSYVFAMTIIITYAVMRYASGRLWIKLASALFVFDVAVPNIMNAFNTENFNVALALGFILPMVFIIPWSRESAKAVEDYPREVKNEKAIFTIKELVKNIDGTTITDAKQLSTDFIVKKNNKTFFVTVLGLNHPITMQKKIVNYGKYNIQPVLMLSALESWEQKKKSIPVIVNAYDNNETFLEMSVKYKKNKSRKVLIVSPIMLLEILK